MGKDNLLLGTARGKLGSVVFYRTGGEQRFRTRVRPNNPQTNAQLLQRVLVSTVAKAYSNVVEVCDHAFQDFTGKMKNQQRYLRLNIKNFRDITLADVKSWSPLTFYNRSPLNYVEKDATYTVVNPYIVSEGDLPQVNVNFVDPDDEGFERIAFANINKAKEDITYEDLINALGLMEGDQLTFIVQTTTTDQTAVVDKTYISRLILKPQTGDITEKLFRTPTPSLPSDINDPNNENSGTMYFGIVGKEGGRMLVMRPFTNEGNNKLIGAAAIIVSRFQNNYWRRSTAMMQVKDNRWGIYGMETAIKSFLKDTTSSLYLNQASRTRNPRTQTSATIMQGEEIEIEEIPETIKTRRQK